MDHIQCAISGDVDPCGQARVGVADKRSKVQNFVARQVLMQLGNLCRPAIVSV